MYSREFTEGTKLPPLKLPVKRCKMPLDESKLDPYRFRHMYLEQRGISEPVQRLMGVGYDRQRKAITMPWRLPNGELANIKYRRVNTKIFWYEKGGWPVRELVYGIDIIYSRRVSYAVICEAEIDAMSFKVCGVPAVALGGSVITRQKAEVIRQSPLKTAYIATDSDKQGDKLRKEIRSVLGGFMTLYDVYIPRPYKDANEALSNGINLKKLVEESRILSIANGTFVRV